MCDDQEKLIGHFRAAARLLFLTLGPRWRRGLHHSSKKANLTTELEPTRGGRHGFNMNGNCLLIVTDADLNENDVLFGRGETIRYTIAVNLRFSVLTFLQYAPLSVSGHGISGNPGNVKFRIILQERRQEYLAIRNKKVSGLG